MTLPYHVFEYPQTLNGEGISVGIVVSRFNPEIGEALLDASLAELARLGVMADKIALARVPGALEIPLALWQMIRHDGRRRFHAMIALGAVIRGETYHFEVVSNDACRGIMETQLATHIPIANGILTCNTDAEAMARVRQKGEDCARAAVEMANMMSMARSNLVK
jgi:6,7-dimethyl-8-ribityllumazine synthase